MMLLVKAFAQERELNNAINQIREFNNVFAPYKVPLTMAERSGFRAVGNSRMGLVEIVARIATEYDQKLSKNESAQDLTDRLAYLKLLRTYKQAVENLLETLDDTEKAMGKDIMMHVDKYSSSLNNARKFDGDLDEAMKEVDDYNARFGNAIEEEESDDETGNPDTDVQTTQ